MWRGSGTDMCMYMYMCMYVYMCMYMHMFVCVCTYTCIHKYSYEEYAFVQKKSVCNDVHIASITHMNLLFQCIGIDGHVHICV